MYYRVKEGQLVETRLVEIDCSTFKLQIVQQRYEVSANWDENKFLVDFGIIPSHRDTIVCNNQAELVVALGIVRQAFDNFPICKS